MSYISVWGSLSEIRERVMAATRNPEDKVKADICRAAADGVVKFRCKLREHLTKHMTSSAVLGQDCFEIPLEIDPGDFDWEASRPLKPWVVNRGSFPVPGLWRLEFIELSCADIMERLCRQDRQNET